MSDKVNNDGMCEIELELTDEAFERLEAEAELRDLTTNEVINDLIMKGLPKAQ